MNKIVISGGITADAKKVTDKLATANLAVKRAPHNGAQGEVDYFDLVYLGEKNAEWAEKYLKKAAQVLIVGRIQNDVYTDKEGKTRTRLQIVPMTTTFIDTMLSTSINQVILSGGITADAKRPSDALGTSSLAVNRPVSGEAQTDYFNLLHLGEKRAAFASDYLKKGTRLLVVGSLQNNVYVDKEGVQRTQAQVIANNTEFIGAKVTAAPTVVSVEEEDDDDVIPFN